MTLRSYRHWHILAIIAFIISIGIHGIKSAHAQQNFEQLSLPIGSVFELLVETEVSQPTINWVLTKEKEFLQAGRDSVFRTRFVDNGNYILTGNVKDVNGSVVYKKIFYIRIRQRTVSDDALTINPNKIIAETVPSLDATDRIVVHEGQQVIKISPNPNIDDGLVLDTNPDVDVNSDGNPRNDNIARGTFFSTKSTPIHIWFTEDIQERNIGIGSLAQPNKFEVIKLRSKAKAVEEDRIAQMEMKENKQVILTNFGNGNIGFGVDIPEASITNTPLLFHWNFGDGTQSLLDKPIHKYAKNGNFDVSVAIRNLSTGEEIQKYVSIARIDMDSTGQNSSSIRDPIEQQSSSIRPSTTPTTQQPDIVENPSNTDPNPTQESKDPKTESPQNPSSQKSSSNTSWVWTVFIIISVMTLSILIGFGGVLLYGFLKKKGGVQSLLHKAEDSLMKTKEKEDIADVNAPPPMELPDIESENTVVDATIVQPKTFTESATDQPVEASPSWMEPTQPTENTVHTDTAPSWLQSGIQKAKETGHTMDTPPSKILTDTKNEAIGEKDTQTSTKEDLPDWLQNSDESSSVTDNIAKKTTPEPVAPIYPDTPQPPEPVAPIYPDTPQPSEPDIQKETEAPSWLQSGIEKAADIGQTASSPPPATLTDTSATNIPTPSEAIPESPSDTPSWLTQTPTTEKQSNATTEPSLNHSTSTPSSPKSDTHNNSAEAPTAGIQTEAPTAEIQEETPAIVAPSSTEDPVPSWLSQEPSTEEEVYSNTKRTDAPQEPIQRNDNTTNESTNIIHNSQSTQERNAVPTWLQEVSTDENSMPDATKETNERGKEIEKEADNEPQVISNPENVKPEDISSQTDVIEGNKEGNNENKEEHSIPPEEWEAMSQEDKERARKRLKRKRYRENKKKKKNDNKHGENTATTTTQEPQIEQTSSDPEKEVREDALETQVETIPSVSDKTTQTQDLPTVEVTEGIPEENKNQEVNNEQPYWLEESSAASESDTANASVPSWLQGGLEQAESKGHTQDSPPPAELQDIPPATQDEDVKFVISADSVNEKSDENENNPDFEKGTEK